MADPLCSSPCRCAWRLPSRWADDAPQPSPRNAELAPEVLGSSKPRGLSAVCSLLSLIHI
eukprot:3684469-Alexandrium_andersonii.AAC.1